MERLLILNIEKINIRKYKKIKLISSKYKDYRNCIKIIILRKKVEKNKLFVYNEYCCLEKIN